jgi:hypothetical protein
MINSQKAGKHLEKLIVGSTYLGPVGSNEYVSWAFGMVDGDCIRQVEWPIYLI